MKKLRLPRILLLILLAVVLFIIFYKPPPTLLTSYPENNQQHVLDDTTIAFTFSRNLSERDQNKLSLTTTPRLHGEIIYSDNQLLLTPINFVEDTTYTLAINYHDKVLRTISFTTNLYFQAELEAQGLEQIQDDILFSESYLKALEKYPWHPSLPIENEFYRIVYDFEFSHFRIRSKVPGLSEVEQASLIDQALEDLKNIGVPEPIPYKLLSP